MCIIIGEEPVHVVQTSLFARKKDNTQYLVYQLSLEQAEQALMILPLPVTGANRNAAFSFIDFSDYPEFFDELSSACISNFATLEDNFLDLSVTAGCDEPEPIAVKQIGAYEASYAPHFHDLHRLDKRFALPESTWQALSRYSQFSFAVFKLSPQSTRNEFHQVSCLILYCSTTLLLIV